MNLENNITLNNMADIAERRFEQTGKQLEEIEGGFHARMNGRSMGGLLFSFVGTTIWLIVFGACAGYFQRYVNEILLMVTTGAAAILILVMYIDDAVNFSYYKKISAYKAKVSQLRTRVNIGKDAIRANRDEFMNAGRAGWNYALNVGSSIPDEAAAVTSKMSSMDSLKNGFLYKVKNVFYYIVAVLIALLGSMALFGTAKVMMYRVALQFADKALSDNVLLIICWVATVLVCVVEFFLAKIIWSRTGCSVTNLTIGAVCIGPLMFLILIFVGMLIIMLVTVIAGFAVMIGLLALALAVVCGSLGG